MKAVDIDQARDIDLFWRSMRAQGLVAYLAVAPYVALALDGSARVVLLVACVLGAVVGTICMTRLAEQVVAECRDPVTGALPFERRRVGLSDVIPLPKRWRP